MFDFLFRREKVYAYNQALVELSPIEMVIIKCVTKGSDTKSILKQLKTVSRSKDLSSTLHCTLHRLREAGWNIEFKNNRYQLVSFMSVDGKIFTW